MQSYGDYVIDKKLIVKSTTELQGQATITNGGLTVTNGWNVLTIDSSQNLTTNTGTVTAKRLVQEDGLAIISAAPNRMLRFSVNAGLGMALLHVSDPGEGTLKFIKVNAAGAQTGEYGKLESNGRLWWEGEINALRSIGRSDRKHKEDVVEMNGKDALDIIKSTQPVWFKWKGSNFKDWGFIAQDFKEKCDWAVFGEEGQMGINYQALSAPAFSAITYLSEQVDEQAAKIKGLEDTVQALLQRLDQPTSQPNDQSKKKVTKKGE